MTTVKRPRIVRGEEALRWWTDQLRRLLVTRQIVVATVYPNDECPPRVEGPRVVVSVGASCGKLAIRDDRGTWTNNSQFELDRNNMAVHTKCDGDVQMVRIFKVLAIPHPDDPANRKRLHEVLAEIDEDQHLYRA
jgi:hypothetical protein